MARGKLEVVREEKKPARVEVPPGCVAMIGSTCSFGGLQYEPDKNDIVIVPEAAAGILESHGFKRIPE